MWQPPQSRDAASDPTLEAWTNADELSAGGTAEGANQAAAYRERLVQQGIVPAEQIAEANQARPNSADPASNGSGQNIPPSATGTDGVENLTSFPATLQLSRNFTLGSLTMRPWVSFQHIIPNGGYAGLTQGQIVANLKLLALNVLDPIKTRYPDMFCTCSWRPDPVSGTNQHPRGQAADMQFRQNPKSRYYDIAMWIRDNIPFDQMLLEYVSSPSAWIHISFNPRGNRPVGTPVKVGTMLNHSFVNRNGLTNMASQIRLP